MSPWQPQVTPPAVCSSLTTSQMPRRSGPACSLAAEGPAEAPPTAASEENGAVDPSTLETSPQVKNNVGDKTQGEMRQLKGQEAARAGVRPFLCDTCGKGFTAKSVLLEHQSIHSGEKHFTCATCGRSFRTSAHLLSHERLHHGAQKPFTCPLCEKTFYFKSKLREHQAAAFDCTACPKVFPSADALRVHQEIHTEQNQFTCITCGRGFHRKCTFVFHMRQHGEERPSSCGVCGKSFLQPSRLREHMTLHTGEKRYTCQQPRPSSTAVFFRYPQQPSCAVRIDCGCGLM
uniref:C2H2-type domain-containing protein n=1 Tax=Mola mola TaxID=94237 RepID=A0A3Q3WK66_MOLML